MSFLKTSAGGELEKSGTTAPRLIMGQSGRLGRAAAAVAPVTVLRCSNKIDKSIAPSSVAGLSIST
jgi:hypothetical protein